MAQDNLNSHHWFYWSLIQIKSTERWRTCSKHHVDHQELGL